MRTFIGVITIASPAAIKLTPTMRPSVQLAFAGQEEITSSREHEIGDSARKQPAPRIWHDIAIGERCADLEGVAFRNKESRQERVSETVPSAGFQINMLPTANENATVSSMQKNAVASRAENVITRPSKPLNYSRPVFLLRLG